MNKKDEQTLRRLKQQEILEKLIRKDPTDLYIVDPKGGSVYIRNDTFEAFGGTLYETVGYLDSKLIAEYQSKMHKNVTIMDDDNRAELMEMIKTRFSGQGSINL